MGAPSPMSANALTMLMTGVGLECGGSPPPPGPPGGMWTLMGE